MFTVSALGHQGWLLGDGDTHVLVDPLLTARFTRMPTAGALVYPPRALDLARFPPIDAVLVTHEHPDHLDFATLQLLDPRTPVYLSAHTSAAARRVVASLGLEVRSLAPGALERIGSLTVLPFAPPLLGDPGSNEIDVVPLLVRDERGHGSFFTSIDLFAHGELIGDVRRHLDRPGIWADANSGYDRSLHYDWVVRSADPVNEAARLFAQRYARLFAGWGHPEAVLVTENGFSLGGDLAALDAHVFEVPNRELVAAVRAHLPGHEVRAALPGLTAEMREGELVGVRDALPYLATLDESRWPPRGGAALDHAHRHAFGPATGRRSLSVDEVVALGRALGELARFLFARTTFRGLYQLTLGRDHPASMRPTVALVLRDGDRRRLYEYRPDEAAFVAADADASVDPALRWVAGAEVWASDLLAVLQFQACPVDVFHFGRKRLWNAAPGVLRFDLDTEIELFAHALRDPVAAEALYRRSLTEDARPTLPGPNASRQGASPSSPIAPRAPKSRPVPPSFTVAVAAPSDEALGAEEAADPRTPRLSELVAIATNGAWTLAGARAAGSLLTLDLVITGGRRLELQAGPASAMPRHYKRVGELAFRYGPSGIDEAARAMLDRIIAAWVAAAGELQMSSSDS